MLVVFYCNSKACGHIHIRTDGRKGNEHAACPKCGRILNFICDYHSWTSCDENKRQNTIAGQMLIHGQKEAHTNPSDRVSIRQIQNDGLYYKVKQMIFEQGKLQEENKYLKTAAEDYHENYIRCREKGIRYHDELWTLLCVYDPDKYREFYDYAAGI